MGTNGLKYLDTCKVGFKMISKTNWTELSGNI